MSQRRVEAVRSQQAQRLAIQQGRPTAWNCIEMPAAQRNPPFGFWLLKGKCFAHKRLQLIISSIPNFEPIHVFLLSDFLCQKLSGISRYISPTWENDDSTSKEKNGGRPWALPSKTFRYAPKMKPPKMSEQIKQIAIEKNAVSSVTVCTSYRLEVLQ